MKLMKFVAGLEGFLVEHVLDGQVLELACLPCVLLGMVEVVSK